MFYIFWYEYGKDQEIQVHRMHQYSIGEAPCNSIWFMWPVAYNSYQLHFISIKFVKQQMLK